MVYPCVAENVRCNGHHHFSNQNQNIRQHQQFYAGLHVIFLLVLFPFICFCSAFSPLTFCIHIDVIYLSHYEPCEMMRRIEMKEKTSINKKYISEKKKKNIVLHQNHIQNIHTHTHIAYRLIIVIIIHKTLYKDQCLDRPYCSHEIAAMVKFECYLFLVFARFTSFRVYSFTHRI